MTNAQMKYEGDNMNSLSIAIDGKWTTFDFSSAFDSLEFLYNYYLVIDVIQNGEEGELVTDYSRLRANCILVLTNLLRSGHFNDLNKYQFQELNFLWEKNLCLKKIQYASPGTIDFLGLGKIFEIIKEIIFFYIPNSKQKAELHLLKLQSTENEIKILRELGLEPHELRAILLKKDSANQSLRDLVEQSKIKGMDIH